MLKKILPRAGVNKENTRYTTEGGWYDCDKVRFRQGTPEVIGGWVPVTTDTFLGVCRALWHWVTNAGNTYTSVGTHLKFYINSGNKYYDVTPVRSSASLSGPFTATNGSKTITVAHTNHGAKNGDYVTFYGAASLGGNITATVLNKEYSITYVDANSYTITASATANASDTGHGGTISAVYQINTGLQLDTPLIGWGASTWASGPWGIGSTSTQVLRLWSQSNFGQDLIYAPKSDGIYYWYHQYGVTSTTASITIATPAVVTAGSGYTEGMPIRFASTGALPTGLSIGTLYYVRNVSGASFNLSATATGALISTSGTQSGTHSVMVNGVNLTSLPTASDVPTVQNFIFISDQYRFVFAFGCNDYGTTDQSPMLVRWSDQEDAGMWTPSATNQAGSLPLSHGSYIVGAVQLRQELVVFTDSTVYSMQYVGPPYIWAAQILGDNISIQSMNCISVASGVAFWMGTDKFYKYDGRVQTLRCDLRQYVFEDINLTQTGQVFSSTNEGFNEVWWFYCSSDSTVINRYVIYNYAEDVWYHGSMGRTAWLDTGTLPYPVAATNSNTLVYHEVGTDDNETGTGQAMAPYIISSEFDIDDGSNFGFVWRVLPDLTFRGSTSSNPTVTLTLQPLTGSGSGYLSPKSVGGDSSANVVRTASAPIEQFTNQVNIRVRGRQLSMKVESNQLGTTWQLGSMRVDIRQDGRRA